MILLPILSVGLVYPFSGAGIDGVVNYSENYEYLGYNEYWYEKEVLNEGGSITFSFDSSYSSVSFIVANHPFEDFSRGTVTGTDSENVTLTPGSLRYMQYFLYGGSSIDYTYIADGEIDFLILDSENAVNWDNYLSYNAMEEESASTIGSGSVSIDTPLDYGDDYYVIFYNDGISNIHVNFSIDYSMAGQMDYSDAEYSIEDVYTGSGTVSNLPAGEWYFFIYVDPMITPEPYTYISFDVSFDTGITSDQRWAEIRPTLLIIGAVCLGIVIIALVARKVQKTTKAKEEAKAATQAATAGTSAPINPPPAQGGQTPVKSGSTTISSRANVYGSTQSSSVKPTKKCAYCSNTIASEANFCNMCGRKQMGRAIGTNPQTLSPKLTICTFCGSELEPNASFCHGCGTKVHR